MKQRYATLFTAIALILGSTAQAASPAQLAQQNKMKTCAAEYRAKGIAKSEYRSFMSGCLKGSGSATTTEPAAATTAPEAAAPAPTPAAKPAPAAAPAAKPTPAAAPAAKPTEPAATTPAATDKPVSQRDKMKTCNADAATGNLKGAERKAFMKDCLSR